MDRKQVPLLISFALSLHSQALSQSLVSADMYWQGYTRERAAQDLLRVSHKLSLEAYVFRPIDSQLKQQAIGDLSGVKEELLKQGYMVV